MNARFSILWLILLLLILGLYAYAKPWIGLWLAAIIGLIMLAKWLGWKAENVRPPTPIAGDPPHTGHKGEKRRWHLLQYTTLAIAMGLWLWLLYWQLQHAWAKENPLVYHGILAAVVLIAYLIPWRDKPARESTATTTEGPSQPPEASRLLNFTIFHLRPLTSAAIGRMLRLLAVFVLPVLLFDGCLNRDPCYYLDKHTHLLATHPGAPLWLTYANASQPIPEQQYRQVPAVSEFLMSGTTYIGTSTNTEESIFLESTSTENYFIVSSKHGHLQIYATKAERDRALERDYQLKPTDMHGLRLISSMRANPLYPYNLLYYFIVTLAIVLPHLITRRRHTPTPAVNP